MYKGIIMAADPTPRPIRNRPTHICAIVYEVAWTIAPSVNSTEANQILGLRPYLSPVKPAIIEPTKAPAAHSAVMASFSWSETGRPPRSLPRTTRTPEMTPVSSDQYQRCRVAIKCDEVDLQPKSEPPIAVAVAHSQTKDPGLVSSIESRLRSFS